MGFINKKMYSLQMTRSVAAILVLFYHTTLLFRYSFNYEYAYGIFSFGYSGVDIFFVLSGFLMYYLHHNDFGNLTNTKMFIKKRFIRIYPIYWIFLIIILCTYFVQPTLGTESSKVGLNILKSFALFPQAQENHLLGVAWTLSYEVFFYLCFGIAIAMNKKITPLLIGIWLTFFLFFSILQPNSFFIKFLFSPINIEFLLGIFVAFQIVSKKSINFKLYYFGGALLFSLAILNIKFELIEINRVIQFGVPASMIIFGTVSKELYGNFTKNTMLIYLGDASYSIYLTHYLLLSLFSKIFSFLNFFSIIGFPISVTLIIVLTLLVGCLFHEFIEKPALKILSRLLFKNKVSEDKSSVVNEKSS